ncbi:dTDP-4-dehydrorhamnose reductase [Caldimonas thermodepolymerans]|uniref:dTDP-4-dehydrorhamnose reductase n=1 Tax=Caldimonas thermodepolymerans TaxID=215580 RepID=UPI002235ECA8|nr:dTDP-4-dehydrorhamnose reductase [Caldimonas thermodepolymerans]UZG44637.1 dTDP-4-dehydrorhamnose reductase [Caldimonas thermodepolymerans]
MKLLLLGPHGQLGWELRRALAPLGEVIALDRRGDPVRGWCGDLMQPVALARTVEALRPDAIVNAAAYTDVDRAEREPGLAMRCNAEAPAALARAAAQLGAWLLHYSTDYVFDGSGEHPFDETAPPAPLNTYGRSKLEGEERIRASGCRHLILRTGWLHAARGENFVSAMLRLGAERERLQVVADQVGAPTGADLVADLSAHALRAAMQQPALAGTYHVAASGWTSWHGYALRVFDGARRRGFALRVTPDAVEPIPSSAWPAAARRPLNGRLDTTRFRAAFGLHLPPWEAGVERLLDERLGPAQDAGH